MYENEMPFFYIDIAELIKFLVEEPVLMGKILTGLARLLLGFIIDVFPHNSDSVVPWLLKYDDISFQISPGLVEISVSGSTFQYLVHTWKVLYDATLYVLS